MTRAEAFREVARAGRAIADLADRQRDTVDWWTQYGTEFQKLNDAFIAAPPKKDTHNRSATNAMEEIQRGREQT